MHKFILLLLLLAFNANAATFNADPSLNLLFFGAFGMILLYNLGYLMILKNPLYSTYLMFHVGVFIIMLFHTGLVQNHWFDTHIYDIPVGIFFMTAAMFVGFSRDFLDVQEHYPKYIRYFHALIISNLAFFALSEFVPYTPFVKGTIATFISLEVLALLALAASLGLRQDRYAQFYLASFSPLLLALGSVGLEFFALVDLGQSTPYLFEAAILIEAAGLSFAVSYKQKETNLKLKQNELLFKELSHRVQNNLQQVISILTLQKSQTADPVVADNLEETINRISSISLIHKTLQNSAQPGNINVHEYLNTLLKVYEKLSDKVGYSLHCEKDTYLSLEKLTPLALILNELITNSIKYAFEGVESPSISIRLEFNEHIHFSYEDNGHGFDPATITPSIGTKLITLLSKSQLKGSVNMDSRDRYLYELTFC